MATKRKPARRKSRNPEDCSTLPTGVMIPASAVMLNTDGTVSAVIDDSVLESMVRPAAQNPRRGPRKYPLFGQKRRNGGPLANVSYRFATRSGASMALKKLKRYFKHKFTGSKVVPTSTGYGVLLKGAAGSGISLTQVPAVFRQWGMS